MNSKSIITLFFISIVLGLLFITSSFQDGKMYKTIPPPYLKQGDTIAIVATARKYSDTLLTETIALIESWGLRVKIGKSVGLSDNQLAGSDQERSHDFQIQLDNPTIKAIWCVKGGYGTVRIIDSLDFTQFKKKPKWIIGFSDITVLHAHINNMHIQSIHAIMPINLEKSSEEAKQTLYKSLFGTLKKYEISTHPMNILGKAEGVLIGGNLSILYNLTGTPTMPDYQDKILYLEDLDEYLYHVDRMMMNLERSGALKKIKGIIVGGMTEMKDNTIPWGKDAYTIIEGITKKYSIPTIYNFPAGHIDDNRALILGKPVKMEVEKECSTLVFLEDE